MAEVSERARVSRPFHSEEARRRKLSTRQRRPAAHGERRPCDGMSQGTPHAAGVDIGAQEMVACVPDGQDHHIVRALGTDTADLEALAAWFLDRAIQPVAMESTGV